MDKRIAALRRQIKEKNVKLSELKNKNDFLSKQNQALSKRNEVMSKKVANLEDALIASKENNIAYRDAMNSLKNRYKEAILSAEALKKNYAGEMEKFMKRINKDA